MPITSNGNICRSKSARICCTRMAPAIEPISVRNIVSFWSLRFTARRRIKYRLAEKEPPTDCSLLVASACAGEPHRQQGRYRQQPTAAGDGVDKPRQQRYRKQHPEHLGANDKPVHVLFR